MSIFTSQGLAEREHDHSPQRPTLSRGATDKLREGLAACRASRGLSSDTRNAIVVLCAEARGNGWNPEQLIIAVKDACAASTEIPHTTTTAERDTFLAMIITGCIQEFFRADRAD